MFTRRIKTVASIMESFRRAITDLEAIVMQQNVVLDSLHAKRNLIDDDIQGVDLEIHQARGTADRMSDLVFGPDLPEPDVSNILEPVEGGMPKPGLGD